ncbi:hypothetical protein TrLO_g8473 [Triparma laevis f. longispina]|uniref:Thioredoxin domain-containing protein n=1 Tax=Triparma laevis f. longispina TaxID=1714387 RepID=A0A9W7C6L5_9STRA|nr:hypothetical protein TrLO_g8473 [Triparma laevis f. longispina]
MFSASMTVILLLALLTIASATLSTSSPYFSPKPFGISPSLLLRGGADDAVISVSGLSDVNDIILKNPTVLIVLDFTATWCGPCKMITPFYHTLSEKYDKVVFLSVDVDECPDVASEYDVSAMPTFVFLKEGEVVDRLQGANGERLEDMVKNLM